MVGWHCLGIILLCFLVGTVCMTQKCGCLLIWIQLRKFDICNILSSTYVRSWLLTNMVNV